MDVVNQKALEEIEEYKQQGCHMLIPTMGSLMALAEGYVMTVSPVQISPDPNDGDVYPHESSEWNNEKGAWKTNIGSERVRFHAQGLQAIAEAADVRWSLPEYTIDPVHPRVLCNVTGAVMKPNGQWRTMPDCFGSDLDIIKEELIARYTYEGIFNTKKQYLVDRELLQKKKHQKTSALTGAQNRVIIKLLRLRRTYTIKELERPFVFVQISFRPDLKDPKVRMMVTQSHIFGTALTSIFGIAANRRNEPPAIEYMGEVDQAKCHEGVIDMESEGADHTYTLKPEPPVPEAPPFAMPQETPEKEKPMTTAESLRVDFLGCDAAGQCAVLATIIKRKNAAIPVAKWLGDFKPPAKLETIPAEHRLTLYDHLCKMPDGEGGKQ